MWSCRPANPGPDALRFSVAFHSPGDRINYPFCLRWPKENDIMSDERITAAPANAAPAAEWLVIHGGKELCPYSLVEMIERAAAGEIAADDLVKQTGCLWAKAREFPFLQREFLLRESREKTIAKLGQFQGIWLSKKALVIGASVVVFLLGFTVVWLILNRSSLGKPVIVEKKEPPQQKPVLVEMKQRPVVEKREPVVEPKDALFYLNRGNDWLHKKDHDKHIADFN